MAAKPKLLYVVTEDWYFVSHRLSLARAAANGGYEVAAAVRVNSHAAPIETAGIKVLPLRHLKRSSVNPFNELAAIAELAGLYRRWKPTIVHHVAAKPVIYGGLAARWTGVPAVVNALAGLGFVYTSEGHRARSLRPLMRAAYRAALRHPRARLILQNADDVAAVSEQQLTDPSQIRTIEGSGVDARLFTPPPAEPLGTPIVVLASRMLWDKGVREFVEAAGVLRAEGKIDARFVLVGDADNENPSAIPQTRLDRWKREGLVEWWGHRDDMPLILQNSHVVCLPSYREGLPKVLLEAAACGRPIVTSDVPGCRSIVQHGVTGLLVPARDPAALATAIKRLLADERERRALGERARAMVLARFTIEHVNTATLATYAELLQQAGATQAETTAASA
jgi:glycosyltransferase involved in cell wall biosynthesis